MSERVSVQAGDYQEDDLGNGYDAALVFNVIHAHSADENLRLLKKIAQAIFPNGRVVILVG